MKTVLFLVFLPIALSNAFAQSTNSQVKDHIYKAEIKTLTSQKLFKGYVYFISDSSITITSKEVLFQGFQNLPSSTTETAFDYNNIRSVSLMRKNGTGNGILIGALIGAVLGGTMTYALIGKPKGHASIGRSEAAAAGGVVFGLIGGLIGGVGESPHDERFRVGGNYENFKKVRSYFEP